MRIFLTLTLSSVLAQKLRQNWRAEAAHLPVPARLAAFTLIELSIVLVIIGLIVGGVLVGQDLIHAAELRSVISMADKLDTSVNTFKLKYNCLPGDCATATNFFTAGTCPSGDTDTNTTCNGDGDKAVDNQWVGTAQARLEHFRFFQHLALAGLLDGSYSGVGGPGNLYYDYITGTNSPKTPISGLGVALYVPFPVSTVWPDVHGLQEDPRTHELQFGSENISNNINYTSGKLTVQDLINMDQKVDDGLANDGLLRAPKQAHTPDCVTGTEPDYAYNTASLEGLCLLMILKKW